ncbi:MAG: dihydroorotate dehydrogenase electron transfer subunit [Clostridia bacterium]|nr:dihydroorotate dehydrogenase electron transfer subunit [Clostridia bacterium]
MQQALYTVADNCRIARDIYKMTLLGDTTAFSAPGQFVNIKVDGFYLRRPISVCHYNSNTLTLIYKTVGKGTDALSRVQRGAALDLLTGLGNGFDLTVSGDRPLIIGGGVGVPPLYRLCRDLSNQGKKPTVILGFNSEADMFYIDEFARVAYDVRVVTADGSFGDEGLVTDVMAKLGDYTYFYACGPIPMLKAVCRLAQTSGQVSLEERMGCGFGACMGCSIQTTDGAKRVCKDGPVFTKEALEW